MCELVAQRRHHVDHQRTHGIETRDARQVHAQKWRSQVAWLVSKANVYTDLTAQVLLSQLVALSRRCCSFIWWR